MYKLLGSCAIVLALAFNVAVPASAFDPGDFILRGGGGHCIATKGEIISVSVNALKGHRITAKLPAGTKKVKICHYPGHDPSKV